MTLNFLKTRAQMAAHVALSKFNFGLANYRHPDRVAALASISKARSVAYTATTPLECVEIHNGVQAVEKIPGDMAEVGVFRGGTAAVMLNASHRKHLHLFDTFAGLPESG